MPRNRILFVSKTAEATGPTTSLTLLLKDLSVRHHTHVLVQGAGPFSERLEEMAIAYSSIPAMGRSQIPKLLGILQRIGPDLVYANETSKASRHVCLAARLLGIPFLSHVRSMGWNHGALRLGHLRWARGVIAVSHACGRSVERFVQAGRLHVVHNGVPAVAFADPSPEDRATVRRELGVAEDASLLLTVSHVSPRKGQEFGVRVVRRLVGEGHDVHLALVGALDRDPRYTERLRGEVEEAGLQDRIHVLGFRSEVSRFLAGADLLLHTALADPHPRAVIEAMAAGLPVVAFNTDGVGETVDHGTSGWLVGPKDEGELARTIGSLLDGPRARLLEAGAEGRHQARDHFMEDRTAGQVARIVEKALVRGAGSKIR